MSELTDRLVVFIQSIISKDEDLQVDEHTQLLELGILDSLKTAVLLNFIHNELKASVPHSKLRAENFKDIRSIAMVIEDYVPVAVKTTGDAQ